MLIIKWGQTPFNYEAHVGCYAECCLQTIEADMKAVEAEIAALRCLVK